MPLDLPAWAIVSAQRREHIARVAGLLDQWAAARGLDAGERERCRRAAVLHDALRDAGPGELAQYAPQGNWPRKLWHGPAAAMAAERHGETDPGVLSAIRCHSVGCASWDHVGRLLYLADYLEPGRPYDGATRAARAERVPSDLEAVLREVAAERIAHLVQTGRPVMQETLDFWNQLVADASSPA